MVHEGTRPWKRPSWRSMPLEERRVRSPLGDTPPREALGANWRSAQCVTSLYDAFVQLQQENEALREDARQVKQEVELQGNQGKLRQPEDTRCEQFEQEIRLLRSEKLRLEQTHRQQLTALETRASTSETTHRQLLAKYQERFALDPLEAKRSALAVKTMQNTLHNTLLEKEELAIRYGELKDLYRRFQHEQTQTVQTLQDKVHTFERQRKRIGQQRVVNALAVWSTNRMERAWQQWSAVTRQCRQQEQHKQLTSSLEHQTDEKIAQIRSSQAAVLIGTLLQRAARRTFTQWKNLARKKAERRRKGVRFTEERNRRTLQRVVTRWKVEVLKAKDHQMAVTKLRRLLNGHKRRDGVRKWRVWVFRSVLTEKTREVEELRRVMTQQASKFEEMESALEATQMESKETATLYQEEKARYDADIQSQRATELAIRQKLGRFFTKRSDRQLLRQLIGHWKQTAKHQHRMNERAALVASKLKIVKTQRAVRVWHSKTRLSRRSRLQTQQIISRMRQLGVLRCFNSWKESVEEVKKRKEVQLRAVFRMKCRGMAQCFAQWAAFRAQRVSIRRGIEVMTKYALKQQTFFVLDRWKCRVEELKTELRVRQQQLIQQVWENRLLQAKRELNFQRDCFTRWHHAVLRRRKRDLVVQKCIFRLRNGILARIINSWREFLACRGQQRALVRRWVGRCHTGVLQRAWSRWQRQIVLKEQQFLLLQVQIDRDCHVKQLEEAFEEFRSTQKTLLEQAEHAKSRQEAKFQEVQAQLQQTAKREHRYAAAFKALCSSREKSVSLSRNFKGWQRESRQAIRRRHMVQSFRSNLETLEIRRLLMKWRRLTARQRRLSAVFNVIQSCFSQYWRTQCFAAWKAARQQGRAVRLFSAAFARNSDLCVYREVFTQWWTAARKKRLLRRTLEKIWLTSVHAKMRQCFQQWTVLAKAEAAKEQSENRKARLAAIQAKVWWKRSVSASRMCFVEWRNAVVSRRKQRLAERKLGLLQQARWITLCFSAWVEFLDRQALEKKRNQRFIRWVRTVERRQQERAMTTWKLLLLRTQQQELQQLQILQAAQQEEFTILKQSAAQMERKLLYAVVGHDESKTKMQFLTECGLVAKVFNALKLKVSVRRYQRHATLLCQKNAQRRQAAALFSHWRAFSQSRQAVNSRVAEKVNRLRGAFLRSLLLQWRFLAYEQHIVKQKQLKLRRRAQSRLVKRSFSEWHRTIHRDMRLVILLEKVEVTMRRLNLKSSFMRWHEICMVQKHRDTQAMEKSKRIVQFLMGKHEAKLINAFHSWQELTRTRRKIHDQARAQCNSKQRALVARIWGRWRATVAALKLQRRSVRVLYAIAKRFYLRTALSKWRSQQFASQIAALQAGNTALSHQIEDSSHRLQASTVQAEQLSVAIADLQHKLREADSRSAVVGLQAATERARCTSLQALGKILINRMVAREVSTTFTLWKEQLFRWRRRCKALATVALISQRRLRGLAFWVWKVKTERKMIVERLQSRSRMNDLLLIVRRWKTHTAIQGKRTLFLTKRCLLAETGRSFPISIAFGLWKNKTAEFTALQNVTELSIKLQTEKTESAAHLRRLRLGKWCWMAYHHRLKQMRAFLSQCYANSTKLKTRKHRLVLEEMRASSDAAIAQAEAQSAAQMKEQMGSLSAADERLTAASSFQALQTLIRRIFQPTSVRELFVSVSSTFAQILHGSSAILFLFDPSSNELWTQREESQLIQVPASLGISGSTLSSGATLLITDVLADPRFHPMVDQLVLSGLRQAEPASTLLLTTSRLTPQTAKATIGMLSSALVSSDGSVYGVLQVAFPTSGSLSTADLRVLLSQTQLYSKTCCFYVEQMLFEMLRNCRDRVSARTPAKFAKLFKQNKNWRKYYAAVERKASDLEGKLRDVLDDREKLILDQKTLQERHQCVHNRLEASERNSKDVGKQVVVWKKKLSKWQMLLDAKDRAISEKTSELEDVAAEFARYRRDRRSKDLQSVLLTSKDCSNSQVGRKREPFEGGDEVKAFSDRGQLSLLRADQTRLKSQLVRAEADNLLLVKAISIARNQHGELPRTIQAEVTRVATRVSLRSSSDE